MGRHIESNNKRRRRRKKIKRWGNINKEEKSNKLFNILRGESDFAWNDRIALLFRPISFSLSLSFFFLLFLFAFFLSIELNNHLLRPVSCIKIHL